MRSLTRPLAGAAILLVAGACTDDPPGLSPLAFDCPALVVYSPTEVDTRASLILATKVVPVYPDAARVARVEGEVLMTAIVSVQGNVCMTVPVRVDPPGWEFEDAAAEAIRQWRYVPATLDGEDVASIESILVEFTLNRTPAITAIPN